MCRRVLGEGGGSKDSQLQPTHTHTHTQLQQLWQQQDLVRRGSNENSILVNKRRERSAI